MSYFVMVCEGKHPIKPIRKGPRKGGWRLMSPGLTGCYSSVLLKISAQL
jgi:hypothetical protein